MAVKRVLAIFIVSVITHFGFIQMYINFCTPHSIEQLMNIFTYFGSPFCNFLNTVQYNISQYYVAFFSAISTYILTKMFGTNQGYDIKLENK